MTNYEKIKNMSVKEMAELLQESPFCTLAEGGECTYKEFNDSCYIHAKEWLNSEAEE